MSMDGIRRLAREGLKRHALIDQCICDRCVEEYGPDGAPGRCGHCRDSQQGDTCTEAQAFRSILSELDDRVMEDHRGDDQEACPWCAKQVCQDCGRARYSINPENPPTTPCPRCRGRMEVFPVRHTSPEKAADHRLAHRIEKGKGKRVLNPIFKRLPDGSWGVQGVDLEPGEEVQIERRDGEMATVIVGRILDTNEYGTSVALIARSLSR